MAIKNSLFRQTKINGDIDTIWEFFSSPRNLSKITPPDMNFEIRTKDLPDDIHEGLLIEYKVNPAFNIPTKWVTKIASVEPGKFFVDTQLKGPYKRWEHSHVFEQLEDGVLVTDHVLYELPGGTLGKIAEGWVTDRLDHIFDYREQAIQKIFN